MQDLFYDKIHTQIKIENTEFNQPFISDKQIPVVNNNKKIEQ